jgi:hypothetical protein
MLKYLFLVALVIGLVSSVEVDSKNRTIDFKDTLGCGRCINGGFIFCVQANEGDEVETQAKAPTRTCCENAEKCP